MNNNRTLDLLLTFTFWSLIALTVVYQGARNILITLCFFYFPCLVIIFMLANYIAIYFYAIRHQT